MSMRMNGVNRPRTVMPADSQSRISATAKASSRLLLLGTLQCVAAAAMAGGTNTPAPMPAGAPSYLYPHYMQALRAPLPSSAPGYGSSLFPASQLFSDPSGYVGAYLPGGAVPTTGNAFFQSLGTNGRACYSCHRPENGMSISASNLNQLFLLSGGTDPVFAPVDGSTCPKNVPAKNTLAGLIGGLLGLGNPLLGNNAPYSLLLNKGLFRIFLPVPLQTQDYSAYGGSGPHPVEFSISVVSDPYGCNTDPTYATQVDANGVTRQMVSVYRRPRMSTNLKFVTAPGLTLGTGALPNIDYVTGNPVVNLANGQPISGNIMYDGREPTLQSQATDATLGHAQALTAPTAAQVAQMVAFESGIYSAQSSTLLGLLPLTPASNGSGPQGGPAAIAGAAYGSGGFTTFNAFSKTSNILTAATQQSILRGQTLFNTWQFSVGNAAGFNNASLLGITNPFTTTCSSCHGNQPTGNDPFSAGQRDIGIGGQAVAFGGPAPSSDLPLFKVTCKAGYTHPYYGSVIMTTDPGLAMITGRCQDVGRKSVPQLRALASRAPYFSDGSASSLAAVVAFYNYRFNIGLNATQANDLVNFLQSL